MRSSLTTAAALSVACAFVAAPAAARPYLMLSADDHGFQALDLGNVKRTPEGPDPQDRSTLTRGAPSGQLQAPPLTPAAQARAEAEDKIRVIEDKKFLDAQIRAGRLHDDRIAPANPGPRPAPDATPMFIPNTVEITLIDGVLEGAPYGDKVAPLVERRVEMDCTQERWRTVSSAFVDAQEAVLAKGETAGEWRPFGENLMAPVIQAAACKRQYRQAAVSRYLNIGEILANYQAAHSAGVPQPKTRQQLLAERFKNSH